MATKNSRLESLSQDDILRISEEYLLGWHKLEEKYGFRLAGLNSRRRRMGLDAINVQVSIDYRVEYVLSHYSKQEILDTLRNFMLDVRVDKARWVGIELFGCRFSDDYAVVFKRLVGEDEYSALAEGCRRCKLVETQLDRYGGVGLAGTATFEKARSTNQVRYGADNPMQSDVVQAKLMQTNQGLYGGMSPFNSPIVRQKSIQAKQSNLVQLMSEYKATGVVPAGLNHQLVYEFEAARYLLQRFRADDVWYQYGIHPSDPRYPFNCDFYIKSLDLFIEMNGHYSHGGHWFDDTNHDDLLRVKHLTAVGSARALNAVKVWTKTDVLKRQMARDAGLRYLVFWDGGYRQEKKKKYPRLADFLIWFNDFDCDYDSFVNVFSRNTW